LSFSLLDPLFCLPFFYLCSPILNYPGLRPFPLYLPHLSFLLLPSFLRTFSYLWLHTVFRSHASQGANPLSEMSCFCYCPLCPLTITRWNFLPSLFGYIGLYFLQHYGELDLFCSRSSDFCQERWRKITQTCSCIQFSLPTFETGTTQTKLSNITI
jgi:hypothetical protein